MGRVSAEATLSAAERMAADDAERAALQRRILVVIVAGQVLGGAGLAAGITVGALLAQDMLGSDSLSGLPTALFTLGSALAAFLVGRITQRCGRRVGIGLGFSAGGLGAIGVVAASVLGSIPLLLVALFAYGSGTATNLQARYAGTDLARPAARGAAIRVAMVATTFGAVAGPNLVEPLGAGALAVGVPALAGPFLLAAVAYLGAGAVLFVMLRPDPFLGLLLIPALLRMRTRPADGAGTARTRTPLSPGGLRRCRLRGSASWLSPTAPSTAPVACRRRGDGCTFNGEQFDPNRVDHTVRVGSVPPAHCTATPAMR